MFNIIQIDTWNEANKGTITQKRSKVTKTSCNVNVELNSFKFIKIYFKCFQFSQRRVRFQIPAESKATSPNIIIIPQVSEDQQFNFRFRRRSTDDLDIGLETEEKVTLEPALAYFQNSTTKNKKRDLWIIRITRIPSDNKTIQLFLLKILILMNSCWYCLKMRNKNWRFTPKEITYEYWVPDRIFYNSNRFGCILCIAYPLSLSLV